MKRSTVYRNFFSYVLLSIKDPPQDVATIAMGDDIVINSEVEEKLPEADDDGRRQSRK